MTKNDQDDAYSSVKNSVVFSIKRGFTLGQICFRPNIINLPWYYFALGFWYSNILLLSIVVFSTCTMLLLIKTANETKVYKFSELTKRARIFYTSSIFIISVRTLRLILTFNTLILIVKHAEEYSTKKATFIVTSMALVFYFFYSFYSKFAFYLSTGCGILAVILAISEFFKSDHSGHYMNIFNFMSPFESMGRLCLMMSFHHEILEYFNSEDNLIDQYLSVIFASSIIYIFYIIIGIFGFLSDPILTDSWINSVRDSKKNILINIYFIINVLRIPISIKGIFKEVCTLFKCSNSFYESFFGNVVGFVEVLPFIILSSPIKSEPYFPLIILFISMSVMMVIPSFIALTLGNLQIQLKVLAVFLISVAVVLMALAFECFLDEKSKLY